MSEQEVHESCSLSSSHCQIGDLCVLHGLCSCCINSGYFYCCDANQTRDAFRYDNTVAFILVVLLVSLLGVFIISLVICCIFPNCFLYQRFREGKAANHNQEVIPPAKRTAQCNTNIKGRPPLPPPTSSLSTISNHYSSINTLSNKKNGFEYRDSYIDSTYDHRLNTGSKWQHEGYLTPRDLPQPVFSTENGHITFQNKFAD